MNGQPATEAGRLGETERCGETCNASDTTVCLLAIVAAAGRAVDSRILSSDHVAAQASAAAARVYTDIACSPANLAGESENARSSSRNLAVHISSEWPVESIYTSVYTSSTVRSIC